MNRETGAPMTDPREIVERLRAMQELVDDSGLQSSGTSETIYKTNVPIAAADLITELHAALKEAERERDEAQAENTRLRAALAQSDQPCAYCTLPAADWAKCQHGFPGCARADDAMGCPELGAGLRADALAAALKEADHRTVNAERRAEYAEERNRKTQLWLDDQKALRGVDRNVSFDALWQETCEAAEERDALAADLERAREPERVKIAQAVFDAALKWCGEKERETSNDDVAYFKNNWRALPGLRRYVEIELGRAFLASGEKAE